MCHSENLKLKKEADCSYWICQECHHKQEIEKGAYECKMCKRKYTSDAQFSINNNKLFLVCETCPYPTLISEFSGNEVFVAVSPKREPDYLPFEEARDFVIALNLNSNYEWSQYCSNKLDRYAPKPEAIPQKPEVYYKNNGWVSFNNWLGLDVKKNHKLKLIKQYTDEQNIIKLSEVLATNKNLVKEESIRYIFDFLNRDFLFQLIQLIDYTDQAIFMNLALKKNCIDIFNALSNISYKVKKTGSREFYESILKLRYFSENDICSKLEEYDKEDFDSYLLISMVEQETIVKVFENYDEGVHADILQNIARESSSNRVFILDQAIKFAKMDLASKILTLDIELDEYYFEHDESVEALEKIIKLFPSHWKSFDASFIFYSMYESIDYWAYDIHSLKALFEPLIKYKIDIEINYTPRTELGFSNLIYNDALEFFELIYENTLIDNYKIYNFDFLGCAILESAHKIIHFLISKDFEIKLSHFYLAIEVNIDISVIKKLYRTDFNINRLYKDGNTLLHIAYKNQNMDIVKYLLELNADKNILNNQGRLAMDILKEM